MFLSLNNLTALVRDASGGKNPEDVAWERAFSGYLRTSRQFYKRPWTFETPALRQEEADRLEAWILGTRSEHWSFNEDFYSELGRSPRQLPASASIGTPVAAKFADGPSFLTVGSLGETVIFDMPMRFPERQACSVAFWMWVVGGGAFAAWRHFAFVNRLSGTFQHYLDGVPVGGAPAANYVPAVTASLISLSVSARNVTNTLNATVYVEDVVLSDYDWSDAMVAAVFGDALQYRAPLLKLRGDALDEPGPVLVRGELGSVTGLQGRAPGATGWENNMRSVAFTLHEE